MGRRFVTSQNDNMLSRPPLGFAVAILFICVCVFFQVLGTPVGLIDLLDSDTTVESSLSEGLTILPTHSELSQAGVAEFLPVSDSPRYQLSLAHSLFHPPQS